MTWHPLRADELADAIARALFAASRDGTLPPCLPVVTIAGVLAEELGPELALLEEMLHGAAGVVGRLLTEAAVRDAELDQARRDSREAVEALWRWSTGDGA